MRAIPFVLFAALLLAVVAGQNSMLQSTDAKTVPSAITACAVQGGACPQSSLDSPPGSLLQHDVFSGACAQADLHVVRYIPSDSADGRPLVATWCT